MNSHTHHGAFPVTRWSVVKTLREGEDHGRGRLALNELCQIYWRPIYSYARYQGLPPADAEDLTQSFFSFALEKELFSSADASLGKMRNYLLTAFSRHIKHWQRQANALKRGGGREIISIEASQAENEITIDPADHRTPESIYQRLCAMRIIEAAIGQLAEEQATAGKGEQFRLLRCRLDPTQIGSGNDAEIAAQLGITHDAVRQSISRLRKRFREIMRDLVSATLSDPTDESVQEELAALRNALMG
ncbi:RNA polymerase sigma-70 factor, ECF subfamily [Prosthecobacter fusiformis]|uniref:RNA polymerase sigma-70 factor, ECF subfamily n=1 Tax=Prosthecobacter fusiformis TaxID=48464 RepID=A0A4R7RZM1_9BACT|nr:sigma-70 family RNA polymerase sigma factor [Prosthecobacter fusiformis]TDU71430.1 RNA polymerase sigma-70 factor, ECF subfamily [Prosthecobacter fusiformis]